MDALCGGVVGFVAGYFIHITIDAMDAHLAAANERKTGQFGRRILVGRQISIRKQNLLINQLLSDRLRLSVTQNDLTHELKELRDQYERIRSGLN